jgi:hypothetical protein
MWLRDDEMVRVLRGSPLLAESIAADRENRRRVQSRYLVVLFVLTCVVGAALIGVGK